MKNLKPIRVFEGEHLNYVAFPLGGMGAGMFSLEGTGSLSQFSLHHKPDIYNEPLIFAALSFDGKPEWARVLEGSVPSRKLFFPWSKEQGSSGNGARGKHYGLPRFEQCRFSSHFPFGKVSLSDSEIPVEIEITGWSPFIPGDSFNSSLPIAGLEYTVANTGQESLNTTLCFSSFNFIGSYEQENYSTKGSVEKIDKGIRLQEEKGTMNNFSAFFDIFTLHDGAKVNPRLFRGGWFDPLTILWKDIQEGKLDEEEVYSSGRASPGGYISVPLTLEPGKSKKVPILFSWYSPKSDLQIPGKEENCCQQEHNCNNTIYYEPWYAQQFDSINAVSNYWRFHYESLKKRTEKFTQTLYQSTIPKEIMEAVAANLSILKSPTILRQKDGRIWGWEGCYDQGGCCHGSCTHVWNYAQALCHLFPDLERGLRVTEFCESQDEKGHQNFRVPLPIQEASHDFHAAADGQLGGIIKAYREWRISGDDNWITTLWPAIKQSLEYSITIWDPNETGVLVEPHHNTYDIEFWGPDGMCSSLYLGALKAATIIGKREKEDVSKYEQLYRKGKAYMEEKLFNGEFFFQDVHWKELKAPDPSEAMALFNEDGYSDEAKAILKKEGPKYQYGLGVLSDGILGAWMAQVCGLEEILDKKHIKKHLLSVYNYNFKKRLQHHSNPQRPSYALDKEGGLLLCSWPKGGKPSLPFVYSDEVWTGIEYQVASHLIMSGFFEKGGHIVETCRKRYDGKIRNPYDEYECGHWYIRALSSYSLLQAVSGARYDAVEKRLYLKPAEKGDFVCFLAVEGGYGLVGIEKGKPFYKVVEGEIEVNEIIFKEVPV